MEYFPMRLHSAHY